MPRKQRQEAFFHPDSVAFMRRRPSLVGCDALVEIAGRDSVGAAVMLAREGGLRRVLPTIAYTGTEFGDLGSLFANVERMRRLLRAEGTLVEEPVVIGSPRWWNAVIGRVNTVLTRRYGPWHICIGCHMYLHALRAPLCWSMGVSRLVAGERLGHGGRVKINQSRAVVDAYRGVLGRFGVQLEVPLLEVDDEESIRSLVGEWGEGCEQPSCALSGNYLDLRGGIELDEEMLSAYLAEYLVPVTERILAGMRGGAEADYHAAVAEILEKIGEK